VREGQAAVDDGVRRRFEALGQLLQRADLTTDPQEIEGAVAALRAALAEVKPPEAPLRASFRLVANPGNPATSLTRDAVSRLFLRKTPAWPDGTPAEPVDQAEASPVHQAFALEVHDRTPQALRSTWNQIIFAGRGVPPPELHSDEEVLAYVREHRGALGYVSAGAPLVGVKVLALGD